MSEPITEQQLRFWEDLIAETPSHHELMSAGDAAPLVAEVRRLRGLFSEADATFAEEVAEDIVGQYGEEWSDYAPRLRDLAARIRQAPAPAGDLVSELAWVPPHKCGMALTHNEHRTSYETIEQWEDFASYGDDWVSPEERERAIATDELWVLQWYPDTPVGFCRIAASSLEALRRAVAER